jgi:hypothetical protein
MRRLVLAAIGAVLVLALVGCGSRPSRVTVDCGPLDQAACDRAVAQIIAEARGHPHRERPPPDVPISVWIGPQGATESGCIWEYSISWPGGGWIAQSSCP